MVAWRVVNSAIPVAWSAWLTKGIRDEPESGGGHCRQDKALFGYLWTSDMIHRSGSLSFALFQSC